ncbi:trk system potassium uptake protein TrkA [Natranaerovirga hydrolytica]|uniref:Trk system potassium uptake protein TrkA n=1 Tax=Natranaerovirga hydrolytica TaxID=680378 RepID=A0A4V2Q073_9FIRM|nr:Trk system potassium transporter TrkA [Natranaerovirga hydrolytica]TCK92621.1 trk system potassium uptake protein TrkA [Natranaerovirga hydrolytica]
MRVIIVGVGKLGYKLAESLSLENNDVTVIDTETKALEKISDSLDVLTIKGNGIQLQVLEEVKAKNSDLVIAVTSNDETNMLVASMSKKIGCKKVVARIRNPEYANQLEFIKKEMGIDYIVNPELETAKEVAKFVLKGNAIHMEHFASGKVCMVDFRVQNLKNVEGKKIKDLEIPESVIIVAISRNGQIIIPYGETQIESTDTLYVIGKKENIAMFSKMCGALVSKKLVKKALILGGGKAGYYLANKLLKSGVNVKIIERDKDRCEYLAEKLGGALVIYGDGTDITLLNEEGLDEMDSLISVTGFDEENLLLALLAKQQGVDKVIAKVSRPNYIPIIEQLGIDLAVNPSIITASQILRFIQGGKVVSISLLLGGQAEVIEIIADENSQIVEKKLKDLGMPHGIIIGSIVQDGKVIIPNGESVIHSGDRVVVFCLQSQITLLEKFFYKRKGGLVNELWHSIKSVR